MRITLCSPYELSRVSGISVFIQALRDLLARDHHHVVTLTPSDAPWVARLPPGLRNVGLALWTFASIALARARADVVHANQPHLQSVAALLASRFVGARFVVTYHSTLPLPTSRGSEVAQAWASLFLARYADSRVFVSQATRAAVGRPEDPVIPIGVDAELVKVRGEGARPATPFTFLFVGRQTKSKGFFDLLDAALRLVQRNLKEPWKLIVVGDVLPGEEQERNRYLAQFGSTIDDRGVIRDRDELFALMGSCDVLVLPSHREGLPLVLLEAMALGCVPITTPVGGIPEAVVHGETGLLVESGNRAALADAMAWTLEHRDSLERIAGNARNAVLERYTLAETSRRYLALYAAP